MRRCSAKVNTRLCALLAVPLLVAGMGTASAHYLGQRQVQQQIILQPQPEAPAQLSYLLPGGQDVILQDWALEQGREMQFTFPTAETYLQAEALSELISASILVADGQATLTLQLTEAAEVTAETEVSVTVTRGTPAEDSTTQEDPAAEEENQENTTTEDTTGESTAEPEPAQADTDAAESTEAFFGATFHTLLIPQETIQPDTEQSQPGSEQPVISSLKHVTLGQLYWLNLNAQKGVTYTLSLSVTKPEGGSAYLTNVRYSLDGGATYKLQTLGEDIRIPAQVQAVLLDLSFSQLALGDTVSFIVQGGNRSITLNPTVKASRAEGGYILTQDQPLTLPDTNTDTLQWTMEQLTDGQWQPVPAECFTLTQTEAGLVLAIAEDQHLQAGTYRFTASHRVGSLDIPWDQIPVFVQQPLL